MKCSNTCRLSHIKLMVLYLITSFDIIHKWKPHLTFPEVPWHQCAGYIGSLSAVLTSTALMTWSREGPSWSLDRDVWAVFGLKLRLRLSSSIHDVIADFWRRTSGVRWRLNGMLVFALRCKQDAHFFTLLYKCRFPWQLLLSYCIYYIIWCRTNWSKMCGIGLVCI